MDMDMDVQADMRADMHDETVAAGEDVSAETRGSRADRPGAPPEEDVGALSDDALEAALATHAADLAAAECRFCLMVAEVDRRGLWADQGASSCAHWLSWRCGTSPAVAREHLRVGRALGALAKVRDAFSRGVLSYSKVRALTRIATPEIETMLVEMAGYATAAQLETIVRAYRRASPDEGEHALVQRRQRSFQSHVDEAGMVVIHARLSPEDGAAVLAAIEMTRAAGVSAETSVDADQADALVVVCEAALARGAVVPAAHGPHASVVVHVDEQVLADPRAEGCAFVEGIGAVSAHTVQRLACDASVSRVRYRADGTCVPEGRTRQIPLRMRRAVMARDCGCRWPGCGRRRYVQIHHVRWVSRGGRTRMTNLTALCSFHHRLVHEGGFEMAMDRRCRLRVTAPDGRELPVRCTLPGARPGGVAAGNRGAGLQVDDSTMPLGGEPFSLDLTVDVLLAGQREGACRVPGTAPLGGRAGVSSSLS